MILQIDKVNERLDAGFYYFVFSFSRFIRTLLFMFCGCGEGSRCSLVWCARIWSHDDMVTWASFFYFLRYISVISWTARMKVAKEKRVRKREEARRIIELMSNDPVNIEDISKHGAT